MEVDRRPRSSSVQFSPVQSTDAPVQSADADGGEQVSNRV